MYVHVVSVIESITENYNIMEIIDIYNRKHTPKRAKLYDPEVSIEYDDGYI